MKTLLSLFLCIFIGISGLGCGNPSGDNTVLGRASSTPGVSTEPTKSILGVNVGAQPTPPSEGTDSYIGCWMGMGGGRLRITTDVLEDLGSHERSRYQIRNVPPTELEGMETGQRYILETQADFPNSFLAKVTAISYLSDDTVAFTTYDSYEAYLDNKIVGMGLFGRMPCDELLKLRPR